MESDKLLENENQNEEDNIKGSSKKNTIQEPVLMKKGDYNVHVKP